MLSAILMFQRLRKTMEHALREENFGPALGAGAFLLLLGTLVYTLDEGWNPIDSLYFAVATLTTTSVADPELVLDDAWVKLFTVFYQLIGIGILVEILRRFGLSFMAVREREKEEKAAEKAAGAS
jgi:hypothetical protein